MSGRDPRGLRYVGWTWPEPARARFDAAGLAVRERLLAGEPSTGTAVPVPTRRGPRWDRAWVDEAVTVPYAVDVAEAARLLARRPDLVDECVAVTLREPTWLRPGEARAREVAARGRPR